MLLGRRELSCPRRRRTPRRHAGPGPRSALCRVVDAARGLSSRRVGTAHRGAKGGAHRADAQHGPSGQRPRLPGAAPLDAARHRPGPVRPPNGHRRGGPRGARRRRPRPARGGAAHRQRARRAARREVARTRARLARARRPPPLAARPGSATRRLGEEWTGHPHHRGGLAGPPARSGILSRRDGPSLSRSFRPGEHQGRADLVRLDPARPGVRAARGRASCRFGTGGAGRSSTCPTPRGPTRRSRPRRASCPSSTT